MRLDLINDKELILTDLFDMVTGGRNLIGRGQHRSVYSAPEWLCGDDEYVVKVADADCAHQNVIEYNAWDRVRDVKGINQWFAPVLALSGNNRILLMERTEPPKKEQYPAKVPAFFTDLKRENFGMYKGRIVCHDYGMNLLIENGMTKRMRKAEWWDS